MQIGRARCDKLQGSPDLLPTLIVGWNYRIYAGITLGWLFWYVNFYVITPAYAKEIEKRRDLEREVNNKELARDLDEMLQGWNQ
jgi:hypothetical protein